MKNQNLIKHKPGHITCIRVVTVTAGNRVPLYQTSLIVQRVIIQALNNNTDRVTVGSSGVDGSVASHTGVSLSPLNTVEFRNIDIYNLWLDSVVNGEGVSVTYVE